jgi:hypothetical protein
MKPSLGSIDINLPVLMETRMLIQANSGAGKSHTLRRVLEQTAPHVQQLIIDPDGEFPTLREKFDYIVCAPRGADAVANPQTAGALAVALWKSGSSAILDIYELKKHERTLFVRRFLEALVAARREDWHPTLVALDEIHDFCPQTGSAESSGAVIDLATRGRKRGLCLVGATQRIAKLHKDAAAELLNKAIGRTGLDIDVRRASDELGLPPREALGMLRNLEPGQFFVYGPALTGGSVELTQIGPVATTHPQTGQRALVAPPAPSPKVKAQLAKIEGLQRDAAEEAKTVDELKAELAKASRELATAQKGAPAQIGVPPAEVEAKCKKAAAAAYEQGDSVARAELVKTLNQVIQVCEDSLARMRISPAKPPHAPPPSPTKPPAQAPRASPELSKALQAIDGMLSGPEQRILDAIAWLEAIGVTEPEQTAVAFLSGYAPGGGSYNNPRGRLNQAGRITYLSGNRIALTDAGRALARSPGRPGTRADLHSRILEKLAGPERRILNPLLDVYPAALGNAELATAAGYAPGGGSYNNPRGRLRTLGLIEYVDGGVRARDILFPDGR